MDFESIRSFLSQIGLWIGLAFLFFAWFNERTHRRTLMRNFEQLEKKLDQIWQELLKKN